MRWARFACSANQINLNFQLISVMFALDNINMPRSEKAEYVRLLKAANRRKNSRIMSIARGYPSVRGIIRKSNKSRKGW